MINVTIKITEVTTENKKMAKTGQNSTISPFLSKGQIKPLQDLEVGPCSGPYLLVVYKLRTHSSF